MKRSSSMVAKVLFACVLKLRHGHDARCRGLMTLVFFLAATVAFGNDSKKLLQRIRANYIELTSCSSVMEYGIYRGFNSNEPVEQYPGLLFRNDGNSFRRIDRSDFINLSEEGIFLHIDHAYEEITVSDAVNEELFDTDLESSLKYCGNIVSQTTGKGMLIAMYLNKTHDLPYSRIDLQVDERHWITSITFYYSSRVNFSKDFNHPDYDQVKMKISYTDFDPSWKDKANRFDAGLYLADKKELTPSEQYRNYKIVDLRKK